MRIPRLLEVLGRVGRPRDAAPVQQPAQNPVQKPTSVQNAATGQARPARATAKIYVEDVRVRAGSIAAQEAAPPRFQAPANRAPAPRSSAEGGAATGAAAAGRPAARERISVASEIEGGGQAIRRPPAKRR